MVTNCCRFLCYFCRISRQNQRSMFDHLSYLLQNSGIGLGLLITLYCIVFKHHFYFFTDGAMMLFQGCEALHLLMLLQRPVLITTSWRWLFRSRTWRWWASLSTKVQFLSVLRVWNLIWKLCLQTFHYYLFIRFVNPTKILIFPYTYLHSYFLL